MNQIIKSLKSLMRNRLMLFVNVPGLAVAIAAFLLLFVYVKHEISYEKHFSNKERVVRLYSSFGDENSNSIWPIALREAYTEVPKQIPEIEKACQILNSNYHKISFKNRKVKDQIVYRADEEFFDVFGLKLLVGNSKEALAGNNRVVLTDELAQNLFGSLECLGETLEFSNEKYVISGVLEKLPETTHLDFDVLCSIDSDINRGGLEFYTYYLLNENADFNVVEKKIRSDYGVFLNSFFSKKNKTANSGIEPLQDLHLYSIVDWDLTRRGNKLQLYLISILAFFILLIAGINFINLYIQNGENRILEIGIRKTFGANAVSLKRLFFSETALIMLFALSIAFLIVSAILPYFSNLVKINFLIHEILNLTSILSILLLVSIFNLLAGSYPALYLSNLDVVESINGGVKNFRRKKWLLVSSLLIQFFICSFLIICLIVVGTQINFMKNKSLGFNVDNVITIDGFENNVSDKTQSIYNELLKLNFIKSVGSSQHYMGKSSSRKNLYIDGQSDKDSKAINEYRVNIGFCETMQLQLIDGAFFKNDDKNSVVLNESAVRYLHLENPLQSTLIKSAKPYNVTGIVKDFIYNANAGDQIEPLVLDLYGDWVSVIYLRITGEWSEYKKDSIEKVIKSLIPDYQISDEILENSYFLKYAKEDHMFKLMLISAILAIVLSFVGTYALSAYNVERRTKEIGVRKVNGASISEVLLLLNKEILLWISISFIIASFISFFLMKRWLENYVFKIEIYWWIFFISGLTNLLIAIISVSWQSLKAARRNPTDTLRYE